MVVQGLSRHNERVSIPPETRYARNGAIHLAYQVLGAGPPNLLVVQSGPNSHVDCNWMEPSLARFIRRLASFSRLDLVRQPGRRSVGSCSRQCRADHGRAGR